MTAAQQSEFGGFAEIPCSDALLKGLREALRNRDEAAILVKGVETDTERVVAAAAKAEKKRSKITQAFSRKIAESLSAGKDLPQPSDADIRRIKKLNETISFSGDSLCTLRARKAEVDRLFSDACFDLANKTVEFMQIVRDHHAHTIQQALASLAGSIAVLVATDAVQSALLGECFEFDARYSEGLFSGAWVAQHLINAIPPQVLPPELGSDVSSAAASESTDAFLRSIRGALQ